MATNVSLFASRIRKAFAAVGIGVRSSATQADASVPLITSGSGAASAADPNGSLRLRTDGAAEYRQGSAWVTVGTASASALAATTAGNGASLVGIEDSAARFTATTVEAALAEVKLLADLATPQDRVCQATITVADAGGGAVGAALTVALSPLNGGVLSSAREVLIICKASADGAYGPYRSPNDVNSVTFGTATVGAIVGSGPGWCLAQTDATGAFACTASNTDDETIWFSVVTAEGISNLQYRCAVAGCVPDSATWAP